MSGKVSKGQKVKLVRLVAHVVQDKNFLPNVSENYLILSLKSKYEY
jgi:hypothetical protein